MHGLGNDFVVIDQRRAPIDLSTSLITAMGDRHRGIGFDQLILIEPASGSDMAANLRFYNSDGSIAGACGNGTRCAASIVMAEAGLDELWLGSPAGPLGIKAAGNALVTVAMPPPKIAWHEIPLAREVDTLALPIEVAGLPAPAAVSMGNPHAVFFVDDVAALDIGTLGPILEHDPLFPDRANIGFAQTLPDGSIRLRVFERGAGLTLACGSGACAAFVAAVRRGLAHDSARMIVDGGSMEIAWTGDLADPVMMTGPVALSFTGQWASGLEEANGE